MRATFVSNLSPSVAFSFEPEGLIYISGDRFFNGDGNLVIRYYRLGNSYTKIYQREEAFITAVFLYKSRGNMFLSEQPALTVFDMDVSVKREVLIEKSGSYLKNEFKRLQEDPVYFYLNYCSRKHAQNETFLY